MSEFDPSMCVKGTKSEDFPNGVNTLGCGVCGVAFWRSSDGIATPLFQVDRCETGDTANVVPVIIVDVPTDGNILTVVLGK